MKKIGAISCADKYKSELVNRSLLFVCIDKHNRFYR